MTVQRISGGLFLLFVLLLSACSSLGTAARVGELATSTPTAGALPVGTPTEDQSGAVAERTPVPTPTPGKVADTISDLVGETEIASQTFLGLTVEDWFNLLLALLLALIIYLVGWWLIRRPLRSLVRRTPTDFDDQFITAIEPQLKAFVVVLAFRTGVMRLGFLGETLRQLLLDVFFLLFLGLGLYVVWKLIDFTSDWYRNRVADRIGQDHYEAVVPFFKRLLYALLFMIAVVIVLDHFGFNTTGLAIIVALIALVLYFGSRDTLSDAFSGFVILLDQPFRVGDRIKLVGMDVWGDVLEIGTRTTRILTRDNRLLVVPNSDIGSSRLFNYTLPDPTLRFELDIGVQYDTDVVRIRQIIKDAVRGVDGVLTDKPIEALFIEFGDRGLIYRVRWWVDTYTDPYPIYDKVNEAMYAALGEEGIKVSFTTYNVVHVTPQDRGYLQPQLGEESVE